MMVHHHAAGTLTLATVVAVVLQPSAMIHQNSAAILAGQSGLAARISREDVVHV